MKEASRVKGLHVYLQLRAALDDDYILLKELGLLIYQEAVDEDKQSQRKQTAWLKSFGAKADEIRRKFPESNDWIHRAAAISLVFC